MKKKKSNKIKLNQSTEEQTNRGFLPLIEFLRLLFQEIIRDYNTNSSKVGFKSKIRALNPKLNALITMTLIYYNLIILHLLYQFINIIIFLWY